MQRGCLVAAGDADGQRPTGTGLGRSAEPNVQSGRTGDVERPDLLDGESVEHRAVAVPRRCARAVAVTLASPRDQSTTTWASSARPEVRLPDRGTVSPRIRHAVV
jgi:hypothetical protein